MSMVSIFHCLMNIKLLPCLALSVSLTNRVDYDSMVTIWCAMNVILGSIIISIVGWCMGIIAPNEQGDYCFFN